MNTERDIRVEPTQEEMLKSTKDLKAEIFGYVKETVRVRRWLTLIFFIMIGYIIYAVTRPNPQLTKAVEAIHKNLILITELREDAAKAREENLIMQRRFFMQDSIRKITKDTLYYLH